jgi:hypothetical protein
LREGDVDRAVTMQLADIGQVVSLPPHPAAVTVSSAREVSKSTEPTLTPEPMLAAARCETSKLTIEPERSSRSGERARTAVTLPPKIATASQAGPSIAASMHKCVVGGWLKSSLGNQAGRRDRARLERSGPLPCARRAHFRAPDLLCQPSNRTGLDLRTEFRLSHFFVYSRSRRPDRPPSRP